MAGDLGFDAIGVDAAAAIARAEGKARDRGLTVRFVVANALDLPSLNEQFETVLDCGPGDWGPRRIARNEITSSFTDDWQVDSIEPATIEINISTEGARARRAAITRT